MINDRRQLADVYQQTIDIVLEGSYTSESGEEVELLDNESMLKGSRFYTRALDATSIPTMKARQRLSWKMTTAYIADISYKRKATTQWYSTLPAVATQAVAC